VSSLKKLLERLMNYKLDLLGKPEPFELGTITLWSNEYIARNVLERHLDGSVDSGSRRNESIVKSAAWICSIVGLDSNILDIGCGPGLYGNEIVRKGNYYTGIDISPYHISYAQAHNVSNEYARYQVCDFREYIPDNSYDAVLLLYAIYSFYDVEERLDLLRKIKQALKPSGAVFIEVFTPNHYANRNNSTDWRYVQNGGFWSPKAHIELNSFRWYRNDLILIQACTIDDDIQIWNSWIQLFDKTRLEEELKAAGFSDLTCFGSCYGESFKSDSEVLCVCAH
jgi:SAM-dependent methyltransferase